MPRTVVGRPSCSRGEATDTLGHRCLASVSTALLTRRLKKLEGSLHAERSARWTTAMDSLLRSMESEHVSVLQSWMRERVGGLKIPLRPGEPVYALCSRYEPPA